MQNLEWYLADLKSTGKNTDKDILDLSDSTRPMPKYLMHFLNLQIKIVCIISFAFLKCICSHSVSFSSYYH